MFDPILKASRANDAGIPDEGTMAARGAIQIPDDSHTMPAQGALAGAGVLLVCGIGSSLLYAAMNVGIPLLWPAYSVTSQTVSELSAIGAPTRRVWMVLATIYTLFYAAGGWGVRRSAARNPQLGLAGAVMIAHGIVGLFWPPMHLRGAEFTTTDTLHMAFAVITILSMLLTIGLGAVALGKAFRRYSLATIIVFVVFGTLTGIEAPGIARNVPTPMIGAWERINIAAFMLWVAVFLGAIMRRRTSLLAR